jgi:hypothetical protein
LLKKLSLSTMTYANIILKSTLYIYIYIYKRYLRVQISSQYPPNIVDIRYLMRVVAPACPLDDACPRPFALIL